MTRNERKREKETNRVRFIDGSSLKEPENMLVIQRMT